MEICLSNPKMIYVKLNIRKPSKNPELRASVLPSRQRTQTKVKIPVLKPVWLSSMLQRRGRCKALRTWESTKDSKARGPFPSGQGSSLLSPTVPGSATCCDFDICVGVFKGEQVERTDRSPHVSACISPLHSLRSFIWMQWLNIWSEVAELQGSVVL